MMPNSGENPSPPAGIIGSLTVGFEFVTNHPWLGLTPLVLDLFLWIGPRLSVAGLVDELVQDRSLQVFGEQLLSQFSSLGSQINLFSSLSLPLVGVPALMGGAVPESTPLAPEMVEVATPAAWLGLFVVLSLAGLMLTTVYLGLIGLALRRLDGTQVETGLFQLGARVMRWSMRLFVLGLVFFVLVLAVYLPLLPVALIAGLLGGNLLASTVLLFGFLLVVFYLSMSIPGIFLYELPLAAAVLSSIRMVHQHVSQTAGLFVIVMLITTGTNLLWRLADNGSWLTLISLVGHAFISTSLAVGVFVFYRERVKVEGAFAAEAAPRSDSNLP